MNNFLVVLITISIAASLLYMFLLVLDSIIYKNEILLQNIIMKVIFIFFLLPAIAIPAYFLFKITPVTEYVLGADIHAWTTYRAGSDQIFKQKFNKLSIILFSIWLLGFVCMFLKSAVRSKKLLTQIQILSTEDDDAGITSIRDKILEELKIRKSIKIFRSNLINSPCICGIYQPKIFMPKEEFSTQETELLLRHELYHYKRQDVIYNMFIALFEGIYWFHPIMHFFTSRLFCFCEMTCDQYVLKNASNEIRLVYAELLIRISKKAVDQKKYGITSFVSLNEKFMKRRLYNIMKNNSSKKRILLLGSILAMFVLCPTITYASTLGVTQTYNKLLLYANPNFQEESIDIDDALMTQQYYEYLDNNMGKYFTINPKGTTSVDWKIASKGVINSKSFNATKGGTIRIFITEEKKVDQFKVIIKAGTKEKSTKLSKNGDVNYTYSVTSTDNYTVTVENLSTSKTIHVSGSIIIN